MRLRIGQVFREHQKIGQVSGEHYNFQGLELGRYFGNIKKSDRFLENTMINERLNQRLTKINQN